MSKYRGKESSDLQKGITYGFYMVIGLAYRSDNMDKDVYNVKTTCCDSETNRARNTIVNSKKQECYYCTREKSKNKKLLNTWLSRPWGSATKRETYATHQVEQ
ncbi:hypothetical protein CCP4SC76_2160010 [Gammaproteobacteria bacterium]